MSVKIKPEVKRKAARILLVDDHPVVRHGLIQLFNQEKDLVVSGEAEDFHGALRAIETLNPDIAVVDISLKNISGMELIKAIRTQFPSLPVLVLSMHDESFYAERVLRAGAQGYIMKEEASEKVVLAVRRVLKGETYVSERVSARVLQKFGSSKATKGTTPLERLSDREFEVFQLIGKGVSTSEIAERLHCSVKTIETHRAHIKKKLVLRRGSELVQYAIQLAHTLRIS